MSDQQQSANDNPCGDIFSHKWLDPQCVSSGCQSLFLKHAKADLTAARAEIEQLRQQLATAQAARERAEAERDAAFRECAKWAARCGEAEGRLQGSELAGVVRDWQERAEKAESRLAKVGEVMRKTAHMLRNDSGWMSPNMEEFAWKLTAELDAAMKGE